MIKRSIILIAFSLLAAWCLAHPAINDLEEKNLKGKVKTLKEISDYGSVDTYAYDQNGMLTHAEFDSGEPIPYDYRFEKDSKGRIIKILETDSMGETNSTEEFTYDKKGVLITSHYVNASGSSDYIHYWDKNGLRTKVERLYDDGTVVEYYTYEYDPQGWLTKITTYYVDDSLEDVQTFENDQYGNPTSIKSYGDDGELFDVLNISYEYDKQGNYIKQTTTSGMDEVDTYVMEREIEYY